MKRSYSETNNLRRENSVSNRYTGPIIDEEYLLNHGSNDRRNVRQRIEVDVPPINVPSNDDIIQMLTQLGSNISLVADSQRQDTQQVESAFSSVKTELELVLVNAFNNAQLQVKQRQQRRQEMESMEMGSEEVSQHELLRRQFFADLEPITRRMASELTYGEQTRMFTIIIEALNERLNNYELSRITQIETDHLERAAEIASIAYSWASTQLSVTITNIYDTAPDVTKKLMAIITSIGIIYNYLPEGIRTPLVNVPYLGDLFGLMNRFNNDALLIQNSAATVTSIYYLLRNSGMDPTDSITALGSMAKATSTSCAQTTGTFICRNVSGAMDVIRESTENVSGAIKTGATNVIRESRENVSGAIDVIRESTKNVLTIIAGRLGDILTEDYNNFAINDSQGDSQNTLMSQISISSRHSVNSNEIQNPVRSQESVEIVESLLNTPVSDGGIDVGGFIPDNVVEERFNPILDGLVTDPILANPLTMEIAVTDAVPVLERVDSVSSNISSNISSNDEVNWGLWLFGRSHAGGKGRRFRKSRRHLKMKKTRKGKRYVKKQRRVSHKRKHMRRRSRKA
jgi:hypothetical protein